MKIHHVTLPAFDPPHVAAVLAELVGGKVFPMPHPAGSKVVYAGAEDGTLLEVWPAGSRADVGSHVANEDVAPPARWPHHAYLSVEADEATILPSSRARAFPPRRSTRARRTAASR